MLVDTTVGEQATQRFDQARIPTGMHHPEPAGVDKQRQLVEPFEKVMPVAGMLLELGQGLVEQAGMARRVFAHVALTAARQCRCAPAQGVELVVAHDAQRLAGHDHVVDDVQRLANPRATVDDVPRNTAMRDGCRQTPPCLW